MTKGMNPVRAAIEDALRPEGFSRKGNSWFRRTDELVEVVNLQKSQYGPQFYLNYGIWLLTEGEESFPRVEKCHINMRVNQILAPESQLSRLLDLEADVAESARRTMLAALLTNEFLPFADNCRTVKAIKLQMHAGSFSRAMVRARAQEVLGGTSD